MYCNNCGKNINDSCKYCPICGATIVKEAKIRPKKRRLLEGAVPITIIIVAMIFSPFLFGINIVTAIISLTILTLFGWAIILVWKTHMYFENDKSFMIVEWFGTKKTTYNYSDIGYVKICDVEHTPGKYATNKIRKIKVYGRSNIEIFEYTYSPRIIEWFKYYDVEIKREYSTDS